MKIPSTLAALGMCLMVLMIPLGVVAEEATETQDEAPMPLPRAIYLPLKPAFVVNYGGRGRLHYLKAEVSVRVASPRGANAVRHHMPYIRNQLILLFSRQGEENLDSQEGKELLRQETHAAIEEILLAEEGVSELVEVYFSQLVIQK